MWSTIGGSGGASLPVFDVLQSYNGSGSGATTTGSISATSKSLSVASAATFVVGQGIYIAGAGAAGANLVSYITAISGTTITINDAAGTAVSSHLVQHDDSRAINAAIAAAYTAGGGTIFLRTIGGLGWYRCNGPYDATTNSILTAPQVHTHPYFAPMIVMRGQSAGVLSDSDFATPQSGVFIDASNAAAGSGTMPSVLSGAEWQVLVNQTFDPTKWSRIAFDLDFFTILLAPNPTIGGVNMNNAIQLLIGDNFAVFAQFSGLAPIQPNNTNAVGIIFPAQMNSVKLRCGEAFVVGMYDGIWPGEHLLFAGTYVQSCVNGLRIMYNTHLVKGNICIETCPTMIFVDPAAQNCPIDLIVEGERSQGIDWRDGASSGSIINDPSGYLRGAFTYEIWQTPAIGYLFNWGSKEVLGGGGIATRVNLMDIPSNFGPIAQYDLNGNLNDSAGSFNLTDHGTITFTTGHVGGGQAAVFDGSTQYASQAALPLTGSFSVVGWFKPASSTSGVLAAKWGDDSGQNQFVLFNNSDGTCGAAVAGASSSVALADTAAGATTPGTWYFASVTCNATTGLVSFQLNNGTAFTASFTTPMEITSKIFTLGARFGSGSSITAYFPGDLQAFRVYSRVLASAEITALYNGGSGVL